MVYGLLKGVAVDRVVEEEVLHLLRNLRSPTNEGLFSLGRLTGGEGRGGCFWPEGGVLF